MNVTGRFDEYADRTWRQWVDEHLGLTIPWMSLAAIREAEFEARVEYHEDQRRRGDARARFAGGGVIEQPLVAHAGGPALQ